MIRFPKNTLSGLRLPRITQQEEEVLFESQLSGGMVTSVSREDLTDGQFALIKNGRVRFDKTSRRAGSIALTPTKPDSNSVLMIAPWERFNGDVELIRFTEDTLQRRNTASWSTVAGVLNATVLYNVAILNDRFFFANNGQDEIQEIDLGTLTFAPAGNAPKYRYIIGFNNRLVGANLAGSSPSGIQIGWSGNLNFTEFDSLVDPSAGKTVLVDSTTDYSDDISGLFSFTDIAMLLRRRSLWGIAKQPIASAPFNFYPIATAIGCDAPNTAVTCRNGIAWYDLRTATVWFHKVGAPEPVPIGTLNEEAIRDQIDNAGLLYATYDTLHDEYTLVIPNTFTDLVRMWIYNFRTKAWTYDEQENVTSINNVDFSSATLLIDDLVGTIDGLNGTIDDLGNSVLRATRFYGFNNGEITVESELADDDNSVEFETSIESKTWAKPKDKLDIQTLRIKYTPFLAGSFDINFSRDNGVTWSTYKTVTFDSGDINIQKTAVFKKHICTDQYSWQLVGTNGSYELHSFTINGHPDQAETKQSAS